MSTVIEGHAGKPVEVDVLRDLFEAEEGSIIQYYGRIGNGKTYNATADIIKDLRNGLVVYANWRLDLTDITFDQKDSPLYTLMGIVGVKKRFYKFLPENLHYLPIDDNFMDVFANLTDCKVYLDEGHLVFDSYQMAKLSMEKRASILHTRHFNRTIAIISQRPTAIHVTARANVNIFYKCEKIFSFMGILIFRRSEFQDMTGSGETVDDEAKPISTKWYFANKKVLNAYNTKYLRGGVPRSQDVHFEAYDFTYGERWVAFIHSLVPWLRPRHYGKMFFKWLGVKPRITTIKPESKPAKGLWPLRALGRGQSGTIAFSPITVPSVVGSRHLPVADLSENYVWRIAKIARDKSVY